MDGPFRRRYVVADLALEAVVAVVIVVLVLLSPGSGSGAGRPNAVVVIDRRVEGRAIPAGFLGLSLEYSALEAYAGADPLHVDPVFEQLIRNLSPGQSPVLRIGGDSTDRTWWPLPGLARPPGVTFALDDLWLRTAKALAAGLRARLILGLNLAAGSPQVAGGEAAALVDALGSSSVQALELGNEPELYGSFAWYRTPDGHGVTARSRGYDFAAFTSDFTNFARALPRISLAGPAFGDFAWTPNLAQFLSSEPRVGVVSLHRYPLQSCFTSRRSPRYPTIEHLLSASASTGLAESFAPYAAIAHGRGLPLRIDELNTVSCGADPAISKTFASALWVLDTLFEMARVGVDGVNVHTFPGAGYELFTFSHADGRWRASIAPEYYGLLMFAQAAPPGSRLLPVPGAANGQLKIWATRAPDRRIRVVLINKDPARARVAAVLVRGSTAPAAIERLQAPVVLASAGATLGGQSFASQTATGVLPGPSHTTTLSPVKGRYLVSLPAASAALMTLPADPGRAGAHRG